MAQNYQAIHGSMYAGSLSVGYNPAAIVHVPCSWDITPISFQLKQSTNAYTIGKYSLLSSPTNAEFSIINGTRKRFFFANQDIHLLNTSLRLNTRTAIAFGASIRSYLYSTASNSNWQDSSFSLADYLSINTTHTPLSAEAAGSAWAEFFGTYAQTVFADANNIVNAGITIKYNKAIAGGFGVAENLSYVQLPTPKPTYELRTGNLQYGYSNNFDRLDSNNTAAANRKVFLQNSSSSFSADVGVEFIMLNDEDPNYENKEINDYLHNTKIGISLMDIGSNKYQYSSRSLQAAAGLPGITDTLLENTFSPVTSVDQFNDSLKSITASSKKLTNDFYIYKPTRLIINIDQHITDDFFINAELTIPVLPIFAKNILYIKDMNLLAITPRWETRTLGAYLPVLYNNKNQLWIGGAFKLGPLLFGIHNFGNLFSKKTAQNGGLYFALTFRPGNKTNSSANFPGKKISGKERRRLDCPSF